MPRLLSELVPVYAARKLRRKNPNTAKKYLYALAYFDEYLEREPTTADLTDDIVTEFQDWLLDGEAIVPDTAVGYIKKIMALWRFAAGQHEETEPGKLLRAPLMEVEQAPEHIPIGWTPGELATLFEALAAQTGYIGGIPAAKWWTGQHRLIWDSLSRIHPVMRLPWSQVNLETRYAWFAARTMKFRRKPKGFSLSEWTVEALREIEFPKRELVLPWPWAEDTLWDRYAGILIEAGLPYDRHHKFHCLRRTASSMIGHKLGDEVAAQLLGHSDVAIYRRSYKVPALSPGLQPCDVLPNPFRATG